VAAPGFFSAPVPTNGNSSDKQTNAKVTLAKFLDPIVISINEDQLRERMSSGQVLATEKSN
jgi:hypothetical protein